MLTIYLVLFAVLFQPLQDVPRNEFQLAARLSSPSDFNQTSALSRYTYRVTIPGRKTDPKFQFFKFEMLSVSRFVMHSTDYVAKDKRPPDEFEFTGFYNPDYASGLKENSGEYSIINIGQTSSLEANKINYLSNLYFPINHGQTFSEVFESGEAIVKSYGVTDDGAVANVKFSIDEKEWTASFDLVRMVCVAQTYNCPEVDHILGIEIDIRFDRADEKFPSKVTMKMEQPGKAVVTGIHEYLEYEEGIEISDKQIYLSNYGLPEPDFTKPKSMWIRGIGVVGAIICLSGLIYVFRRKQ